MINNMEIDAKILNIGLTYMNNPIDIGEGCENADLLALLIQDIPNSDTLDNYILSNKLNKNNMLCILFQIYMPLSTIAETFTHYDLHSGNVLIYKYSDNKCIQFTYHMKNNTIISFKSNYIAKIIDYGRCYFKSEQNDTYKNDTYKILQRVFNANKCTITQQMNNKIYYQTRGIEFGFSQVIKSSYKKNISQDLRLLHIVWCYSTKPKYKELLYKELSEKIIVYQNDFYTHEITTSNNKDKIQNIHDAYKLFKDVIRKYKDDINAIYKNYTCIGELHIYEDNKKNMEYKNTCNTNVIEETLT